VEQAPKPNKDIRISSMERSMTYVIEKLLSVRSGAVVVALSAAMALISLTSANADEAQAKNLFKAMSDYLAAQNAVSFDTTRALRL
jgi:hypothetical protein